MEILDMKNTITKIKLSLKAFNTRLEITEERASEPENKAILIIHFEEKKEKKNEQRFRYCGTIPKGLIFISSESQKFKENYLEKNA